MMAIQDKGAPMGRELEYKYKGTEAAFAALEQRFGPFTPITMETTSQ